MAVQSVLRAVAAHPSIAVVGIATIIVIAIYFATEYQNYKRLAHVPGPRWMGWSNLPMAKRQFSGKMHYDMLDMMKKYGPLVRVGPNQVITSDPDTLRKMSAARSEYIRGPYYQTVRIDPQHENIFSMRDERIHKALKARMGPGYAGKDIGGFEPGIDKHVASFVNLIENKYISTGSDFKPMDLALKCNYFALDVISQLGFGEAFGFLREDKDLYQYNEITRQFFPFVMLIGNIPFLISMLQKWPLKNMGPNKGDSAGFGRLMRFAGEFVDGRLAPDAKPGKDMIQSFINAGLNRDELMQEVFVESVAGSDTTATAVRSTFLCLLGNPVALAKLRREIDAGVAAGNISSPVAEAEARELPYLQAVIREGIRMWPPATGILSKQVPPAGDTLCGYDLPAGTQVGHNIFGMMRSPAIFGPDAEMFRPDRWLEAEEGDPDRLKEMVGAVDLVFGYGKWMCLGKAIAQMELNKIIVEVLRRFDFALVNTDRPMRLFGAAMLIMDDFWVRVTKRENPV